LFEIFVKKKPKGGKKLIFSIVTQQVSGFLIVRHRKRSEYVLK
jgi:hypothetical protein